MRSLLDEDLPHRLAGLLVGPRDLHGTAKRLVRTKERKATALAPTEFDAYLTMDQSLEFQQNRATLPVAVLVVEASSSREARAWADHHRTRVADRHYAH